ncbi:hypothetical protein CDBH8_0742 [Corynebacterium diphtheriae BH8]|uniref:Uncharacterized protein n=20 Tax=Corynebacterium TaxID=1716 RepID=Q6NIL7_CORDI|nr:hypothetical protein CDBH8_0742 [Corynebacterium diphtheriae BH8]CAE49273.1 Hypothetical protein DIP0751 [Corynebacterium diphtheriae]
MLFYSYSLYGDPTVEAPTGLILVSTACIKLGEACRCRLETTDFKRRSKYISAENTQRDYALAA